MRPYMIKPLIHQLIFAGVMIAFIPMSAQAADDKLSAAKAQLHQVQQEKRKLEQDKAQLEQDKVLLEQEKTALDAKLKQTVEAADATKGKTRLQSAGLQKELDQARSDNTELSAKLAGLQKQLNETEAKLNAALEARQVLEAGKTQLETNVGERDIALSNCIVKNQKAYETGQEILEKYQNKSCLRAMLEREPFLGIAQTHVENETANYREELDKAHIVQPKPAPAEVGLQAGTVAPSVR